MSSQPLVLAPSLLSADFARLAEEIARVEPEADWLHLDVMDGHFVPNITFGPDLVRAVRSVTRLPLDVHLMIEEPDRHLEAFARAGADILTVHVEACPHLQRTLQHIRDLGCRAGVALNPHTPLDNIRYVLDDVDLVLLMTVNPGFGGQKFLPAVLPKVRRLAAWLRLGGRRIHIEVDGGINTQTAPLAVEAGANVLVAGSAVFGAQDPRAVLRALRAVGA
ncbi:MAG: ribulose-phosphate 3-epimerase [Bacillota bacterium]|nr:ribulose-phosphate 3-epimerase [Bacillota bacterium]